MLAENTEGNLTGNQVGVAKTIHASGADLLELINDILDLSKIESGTIEVDLCEVALVDVKEYIERNFRHVAQQKALEFDVELAGELPNYIITDVKRLQQVLKNLLSNAFKFTEQGHVTLRMEAALYGWRRDNATLNQSECVVAFAVTDTGIGIPEDKQRIIFEAFQQADGTTSRRYGGTGLGLSISREIAAILGGEISVVSVPDVGSTFTFYLPMRFDAARTTHSQGALFRNRIPTVVATDLERLQASKALEPISRRVAGVLALRQILIIESDAEVAREISDLCRARGFNATVAPTGHEGLAAASRLGVGGIVLDARLPDGDGHTVLDRLKHEPSTRHIPVIVMSSEDDRLNALRTGAIAFVKKPVDAEAFGVALAEVERLARVSPRYLLVVEDDEPTLNAITALVGGDPVQVTGARDAGMAMAALETRRFDCMVLDLALPGTTGQDLLRQIRERPEYSSLPIIVYTGRELSRGEETELSMLSEAIVVKDANSPERLLYETSIYLHRSSATFSRRQNSLMDGVRHASNQLDGLNVLLVDDDVRNIFAMTAALERYGAKVTFAETGREGLRILDENPEVQAVLMDIMMPEMDGYEVIRRIRDQQRFENLPVIAVTAKAMAADRAKCIEAGATDYVAKPVDIDHLVSLLGSFVPSTEPHALMSSDGQASESP
jgi:CheY-like chemotaxis protein